MLKRNSLFLFLCSLFFYSISVYAQCNMQIDSMSPVDMKWRGAFKRVKITVVVRRSERGESCRDFHLTFTSGSSGQFSNRYLEKNGYDISYNLYSDRGLTKILKDYPAIQNSSDVLTGRFPKWGKKKRLKIYAAIPETMQMSSVMEGFYQDLVNIKLFEGHLLTSGLPVLSMQPISLYTVVSPVIQLSLVDSGSAFNPKDVSQNLDFGVLEQGKVRSFDMRVYANTSYSVYFSSQNNGSLSNQNQAMIAYNLKINGQIVDLTTSSAQPVQVATGSTLTTAGGDLYPVETEIKSFGAKPAGLYQDTVHIEVVNNQ